MRKLLGLLLLLLSFSLTSCGQNILNRAKAEENVTKFLQSKNKTYKPLTFGEFFSQYYSKGLQEIAKTKKTIAYSIVHTYLVDGKTITDMYFHLDKSYNVIGQNSYDEMTKLVSDELKANPVFDSILKSIEKEIQAADSIK